MNFLPRPRRIAKPLFLSLGLGVVLGCGSGCKSVRMTDPVVGAGYEPANAYRTLKQLPVDLRRVAVLPPTCDSQQSDLAAGRELLAAVIAEELGKTRKFELIMVTPERLRSLTGRREWRAEESLPPDLLQQLRAELDCDAVLFCRLTQYRPYPPLAVGFSFKLAAVHKAELVWAVDEIFDASEPAVVNSARRYQQTRESLPTALADSRSILISPSGFGRYAANSVFQTLPAR